MQVLLGIIVAMVIIVGGMVIKDEILLSLPTKHKEYNGTFKGNRETSIEIDGTVNGEPLRFLVDTGASISCISQDVATKLGFGASSKYTRIKITTANGLVEVPIIPIKSISLAGYTVKDTFVGVLPQVNFKYNSFNAIVGLSFFKGKQLIINNNSLVIK